MPRQLLPTTNLEQWQLLSDRVAVAAAAATATTLLLHPEFYSPNFLDRKWMHFFLSLRSTSSLFRETTTTTQWCCSATSTIQVARCIVGSSGRHLQPCALLKQFYNKLSTFVPFGSVRLLPDWIWIVLLSRNYPPKCWLAGWLSAHLSTTNTCCELVGWSL